MFDTKRVAGRVPKVIKYIQNQKEHHQKKTFTQEYIDFLNAFEIEYDQRFIFNAVV